MKIAFCVAEILQEKNSGNLPVLLHPFILFFFFFFDKALIRERGKITHGIKNMIEYVIIKGKWKFQFLNMHEDGRGSSSF